MRIARQRVGRQRVRRRCAPRDDAISAALKAVSIIAITSVHTAPA
jgi:hypothetical protein